MVKVCKKCGIEYSDTENFCIECGARLVRARPKAAGVPKEFGVLQNRVISLESEIRNMERELSRIGKIRIPAKDIDRLRESLTDGVKRIGTMSSRVTRALERVREGEAQAEALKLSVSRLASKSDVNQLRASMRASHKRISTAREEALTQEEGVLRDELKRGTDEFISEFRQRLDSALQRVSTLENQLVKLTESYEKRVSGRLEKFKVAFNAKINKDLLQLRDDVGMKVGIITDMRKSLTKEIKESQDRSAELEAMVRQELTDTENFKAGLHLEQQDNMKGMETQLLEKLGEMKEHTENIAVGAFDQVAGKLEKGMNLNARDIVNIKVKLGRLEQLQNELKSMAGTAKDFRQELERKFTKEMGLFDTRQRAVLRDGERQLKRQVMVLEARGRKAVQGLGGRVKAAVDRNAGDIQSVKVRLAVVSDLESRLKGELKDLNRLKLLERRSDRLLEQFKARGDKLSKTVKAQALKDVQRNARGIYALSGRVNSLSNLEKELAETVVSLQETESLQKKRIVQLKELEESNKGHIKDSEKLSEDLILQQQKRLSALEGRVGKALDGVKEESQGVAGKVEVRLVKRLGLNLRRVRELKARMERLTVLERELSRGVAGIKESIEKRFVPKESFEKRVSKLEEGQDDLILHQQNRLSALESDLENSLRALKRDGGRGAAANALHVKALERELNAVKAMARDAKAEAAKPVRLPKPVKVEAPKLPSGLVRERDLKALRGRVADLGDDLEMAEHAINKLRSGRVPVATRAELKDVAERVRGLGEDLDNLKLSDEMGDRLASVEAFKAEMQQQLDFFKEFMENLEKRAALETDQLDKKLDGIARMQEKQELEILKPKGENIHRVVKKEVDRKASELEGRIIRKILSSLKSRR